MSQSKTDFWVGVFVFIGLVALAFLALRAGNLSSFSFAPTYRVHAAFDNIGGLNVRAPLKSSGVVVGRAAEISVDNQDLHAVAPLELERRYNFAAHSAASTLTSGRPADH